MALRGSHWLRQRARSATTVHVVDPPARRVLPDLPPHRDCEQRGGGRALGSLPQRPPCRAARSASSSSTFEAEAASARLPTPRSGCPSTTEKPQSRAVRSAGGPPCSARLRPDLFPRRRRLESITARQWSSRPGARRRAKPVLDAVLVPRAYFTARARCRVRWSSRSVRTSRGSSSAGGRRRRRRHRDPRANAPGRIGLRNGAAQTRASRPANAPSRTPSPITTVKSPKPPSGPTARGGDRCSHVARLSPAAFGAVVSIHEARSSLPSLSCWSRMRAAGRSYLLPQWRCRHMASDARASARATARPTARVIVWRRTAGKLDAALTATRFGLQAAVRRLRRGHAPTPSVGTPHFDASAMARRLRHRHDEAAPTAGALDDRRPPLQLGVAPVRARRRRLRQPISSRLIGATPVSTHVRTASRRRRARSSHSPL